MTAVRLTDGSILHVPGDGQIRDSVGMIAAPTDPEIDWIATLVARRELMLFSRRLIDGARRRRGDPRYYKLNVARLRLARRCLDRALAEIYS
ncbi:hypothetical protein [Chelatococcus asaccharovorans]|uniref:hypothetical protein n=1 Tax=Chelatococcus asaccharovorans TaxID=28210 RepID=UPI00224C6DB3|nr:hypothetical protein [Chelatococcus asaccharovorans]CAH1658547.1 conserved hypothetical protein [Chelatococcus asaccharovorans]CAH1688560.1 conserved hypothetical protein [Chelatococcus asaccharovorans]